MKRHFLLLLMCTLLLTACGRGLVRRVSEPAVSLQQVSVNADGSWKVALRLQNYSSIAMRFESVDLQVTVDNHDAGTLKATPAFSISPESADVVDVTFMPSPDARLAVADALMAGRMLAYTLKGRVEAVPEDAKLRIFELEMRNTLSPTPGLPGVLR